MVSENLVASAVVPESDRLFDVTESLAAPGVSGGHSAWRSRDRGLRLRREAHSRSGNFVENSLSSSRHVDHVHTRSVGRAHGEHVLNDARTNSCLVTHAARVNSFGLHSARGNSGRHINSYRCTYNSCGGVRGGTKPMSMSTRGQVGCLAVEKPASLQQEPGRLHVETWAGRDGNPSLPISQVVEIMPGCADMVTRLPPPLFSSVSPGPGREVRNGMGWSLMEKTAMSGVWLFRGALSGNSAVFAFAALAIWVKKGSFFTAWAVSPLSSCSCSYLYGRGTAVGPQSGERCWPLLDKLWRAVAPLMKPWCAEGEVPTAANLNLYRGGNSCVGWHRDDELLFGEFGEAKLIVSVSLGGSAVFRWKRRSCPDDEGHFCRLGHGEFLSWMANARKSSFIGRILVGNRNGSTLRSVGSNSMLPLVLCLRQGWHAVCQRVRSSFPVMGNAVFGIFCFFFGFLLCVLCIWRVLVLLVSLLCTRLGLLRCASCWTRPEGGGRWGHYLCYPWGVCWAAQTTASHVKCGICFFWFLSCIC